MNFDEIIYALKNLAKRRLRSFLSTLSILIGIMAVFALVSFGLGIQSYVDTLAQEAGTDKLFIQAKGVGAPGTDETFFISQDDVDFIKRINGVDEISGIYMKATEIEFREKSKYYFLMGLEMQKRDFIEESFGGMEIEKGRNLKKEELYKVLLGYNYQIKNKIFDRAIKIGDKVNINSVPHEVVGFYSELGNPNDDANIYITREMFEILYPDSVDQFGWAMIKAERDVDPDALAEKITEKLRKHKDQDEGKEDFFVQTFADALETFGSVISVINGVLILIALISMVVASVNIMNTMYTAVLERTKEIGIMKAVGAKRKDIIFIFVFESGVLGAVGGIVGVFLGYIIASAGGKIAAASGFALLQPVFPASLIIGCILFAFLVGAISGVLPAIRASKLKPVDALRYE